MATLVNRAKMTTATTGTGTVTLGAAVSKHQSFADAGVTNGDQVRYAIDDGDLWEIGLGTYSSTGPTLTRGPTESSSAGAAINLSGEAVVYVTAAEADIVQPDKAQTLTNKTVEGLVLNNGYTEEVYTVTGTTPALTPTDGSIQSWTLTANSTPTAGTWDSGQSVTLMVNDGTAYTINWATLAVSWKTEGGAAPALNTTGRTAIVLWKVGTLIYGARVGDA